MQTTPSAPSHRDSQAPGAASASAPSRRRLRVDAHVHLHRGFALDRFFATALRNLAEGAPTGSFEALLLLTESAGDDAWGMLTDAADRGEQFTTARGWLARRLPHEHVSLRVEGPDRATLTLVAGRQIVTAEGLEVLALGTDLHFDDGRPIEAVLEALEATPAMAVIPWGFGKWMGGRGRVLRRLIGAARPGLFDLGDNRARPSFFVEPPLFEQGRARGMRILSGSDPLPMRAGVTQVGAYGFECEVPFDAGRPWRSLRDALRDASTPVRTFGRRERPLPFLRDQVAMQFLKRRRAHAPPSASPSNDDATGRPA